MFEIFKIKKQLSESKANKSYARPLHKKTEKNITETN